MKTAFSSYGFNRKIIALAVSLTALITFIGCQKKPEPAKAKMAFAESPIQSEAANKPAADPIVPPQEGRWATVERGLIRQLFPAVGSIRARRFTTIGPQVTGRILSVLVDVGDTVKKGQELVLIDPKFIDIEVAQRKAEIENARVGLANTKLNYDRMKALWSVPKGQTPSVSQKLHDDSKAQYDSAEAQLKMAEEALRYSEERLRETVIRAPYGGVITKRYVHPGEPVTSAPVSKLLEIQETGILELEFSLPQNMVSQIHKGTPVEFEVEGIENSIEPGEIAVVYPDLDETTRSFRCRVMVENSDRKFRPGLLVQVRVVTREAPNALYVPLASLMQTPTGWQVLVSEQGRPVPRTVEIGLITENRVEIRNGLQEKEQVFIPKTIK